MLQSVVWIVLVVGAGAVAPRLADGDRSERDSRPYQVALYKRVGTTGELGFCGGALVHPQWVLTAAHCCLHAAQQVDNIQAILGAYSLYDRYENGRRIVDVAEVVIHPAWDAATFANDIALLRLANIMQITDTINVVRLPYLNMTNFNFAGMGATVSGWGIPAEGVTFVSPTLRQKTMSVMTDTLCNTNYQGQLPEGLICGFHATASTCRGDNGGPLTIWNNITEEDILHSLSKHVVLQPTLEQRPNTLIPTSKKEILLSTERVGVASFVGAGGCNMELPSVFTRVQRHTAWISDVTGLQLL